MSQFERSSRMPSPLRWLSLLAGCRTVQLLIGPVEQTDGMRAYMKPVYIREHCNTYTMTETEIPPLNEPNTTY